MPKISISTAVKAKVPASLPLPGTRGQPCLWEPERPWCRQPSRSSVWSWRVRREKGFL